MEKQVKYLDEVLTFRLEIGRRKDILLCLHEEEEYGFFSHFGGEYTILTILGNQWERDFTPYPRKRVFHGGSDFLGGSQEYRRFLEKNLLLMEEESGLHPSLRILTGYSLAGLFSFDSAFSNTVFSSFGCVSASLWYPDYAEEAKKRTFQSNVKKIYFSLGDKESNTKNPFLSKAYEKMTSLFEFTKSQGIETTFQTEEGGHFSSVPERLLHSIEWLIEK